MPARLIGEKENTGGKIEFLLLKRVEGDKWECLAKPGKSAREGRRFTFGNGILKAQVIEVLENGDRIVEFYYDGIFDWEQFLNSYVYYDRENNMVAEFVYFNFDEQSENNRLLTWINIYIK